MRSLLLSPERSQLLESIWSSVRIRLPLVTFIGVYLFTCYVGAIALLASERFRTLYLVYSGAEPPNLTAADVWRVLLLLHLGPVALWMGYEAGLAAWRRWTNLLPMRADVEVSPHRTVTRLLALCSVGVAVFSLARAGGLAGFTAWNNYNAYVYARWHLFDTLTFFEFVNLYTLVPVTLACWALNERRTVSTLLVAIALACVIQYPLAIRKALLTSLALMGSIAYAHRYLGADPRTRLQARAHLAFWFVLPLALYVTYVGLTLQTVIRRDSEPFRAIGQLAPRPRTVRAAGAVRFQVDESMISAVQQNRLRSIVLYTALSPLTRTSISAVVYPALFPAVIPFYHPDFGLDILGIGTMPDDNLTVYRVLWPEHQRGSVAAPFQFVLFSQGGIAFALTGSILLGLFLAINWLFVTDRPVLNTHYSVAAGLLIVLAMFAAIDSLRNSLLVSYGLVWGFALAGFVAVVSRIHVHADHIQPVSARR